jgi:hypothetical protein
VPTYDYYCDANEQTVEVSHPLDAQLRYWAEVCYVAQCPLGDTDPMAPVQRVFTRPPGTAVSAGNAELKNLGMTKLVRRDAGVYENVTAVDGEKRYMRHDDPDSLPHLHKKIGD